MFKVQTGQTGVPFEELEVRGVSRRFPDVVPSPERGRWSAPSIARTIEGRGAPAARDGLLDLLGAAERR